MLKNILKTGVIVISLIIATTASAAPNTVSSEIVLLRPYSNGTFFVQLSSSALSTGATCSSVYRVINDGAGAKAVIATLLTAYALGQNVEVEVPTSTGCTGYGTEISSVYVR